jgi:hypothetical protein
MPREKAAGSASEGMVQIRVTPDAESLGQRGFGAFQWNLEPVIFEPRRRGGAAPLFRHLTKIEPNPVTA